MTFPRWPVLGILLLATAAHAQHRLAGGPAASVPLDKHKLSYAIGYRIGSQFADGDPDVDIATLQKAIQDAYAKRRPAVPMQEMQAQLESLGEHIHANNVAEFKRIAVANARKSADYMIHNAQQAGVVQLPSGVQYAVIKHGTGNASPSTASTVVMNYRGMLIDGTEFDSSWAHGAPVSYPVNQMIPGWQDVIPRMHVGDRWRVVIPPQLAYGERGELPRIGPNEALVFEIELLDVK